MRRRRSKSAPCRDGGVDSVVKVLVEEGQGERYYTKTEQRRVASAVALGHRGIEKVRRAGGIYYVQSMSDY